MKLRVILLALFVAVLMVPHLAFAQAAAYGAFSASSLGNGAPSSWLYGGTAGIMMRVTPIGKRMDLLGDVQGRFVAHQGSGINSLTIGPRLAFPIHGEAFTPYAGFQVGIARYSSAANLHSTDSQYGFSGGVQKHLRKHLDAYAEYAWTELNYNFGQFSPQTLSAGIVWRFSDSAGFERKKTSGKGKGRR